MEHGGIYPSGRDAALNVLLAQLFNRTQQGWIGANMDAYDQGLADFTDALRSFGSGEVNSVALAMVKKGLDAPMGQKENQLYSYAARQIAEQGYEGNRYSIKDMMKMTWEEQIDRVQKKKAKKDDVMVLALGNEMKSYGIDDLITMRQEVYNKATRKKRIINQSLHMELR